MKTEREQIQTGYLGDSKTKRSMSLIFAWGSGVFIGDGGPVYVSSQASRTSARVSSISHVQPGARGLEVKVFAVSGPGERS